jgi:hippurate hydrolase
VNDGRAVEIAREAIAQSPHKLQIVDIPASTGSEDFAFMSQEVPACYLLLGTGKIGHNAALHSSEYDFNDEALPIGATLWTLIVRRCLAS